MIDLPINEKATQLKTQQKIYNSPHPRLPLKISRGFPLDITTIAPVTEIATPESLNVFNLSLKKYDARRVIKTGLFAMIRAARPAPIILSPLKKKTLYENMPVIPRRITGIICFFLSAGKLPSIFHVKKTRQTEATANLKNEAEYGSTFCATIFPAMNVPPQKKAVRSSLIYTSNVKSLICFPFCLPPHTLCLMPPNSSRNIFYIFSRSRTGRDHFSRLYLLLFLQVFWGQPHPCLKK